MTTNRIPEVGQLHCKKDLNSTPVLQVTDQDFTPRRRQHESVPCNPLPAAPAPDPTLNCLDRMESSYMMPEVDDDGYSEVCDMYVTDTCYDVEYEDYVYDDYNEDVVGMPPPTPVDGV